MTEKDLFESPDYVRGFVDALEMVVKSFRKSQFQILDNMEVKR